MIGLLARSLVDEAAAAGLGGRAWVIRERSEGVVRLLLDDWIAVVEVLVWFLVLMTVVVGRGGNEAGNGREGRLDMDGWEAQRVVSGELWASRTRPKVVYRDEDGKVVAKREHLGTCRTLALSINTVRRAAPTEGL